MKKTGKKKRKKMKNNSKFSRSIFSTVGTINETVGIYFTLE